jgi:hypothetical protein
MILFCRLNKNYVLPNIIFDNLSILYGSIVITRKKTSITHKNKIIKKNHYTTHKLKLYMHVQT